MIRVVCIVGPTASGKSALALDLAERLGGEIVSADSRQVYRELAIGTAKPTPAERERVPHHCLDLVDPGERFDVAASAPPPLAIADVAARGRVPLVAGGMGLWVRALRGLARRRRGARPARAPQAASADGPDAPSPPRRRRPGRRPHRAARPSASSARSRSRSRAACRSRGGMPSTSSAIGPTRRW
jgi:tRNA dimethylallyltransferase